MGFGRRKRQRSFPVHSKTLLIGAIQVTGPAFTRPLEKGHWVAVIVGPVIESYKAIFRKRSG
jgi:hypothetical protein